MKLQEEHKEFVVRHFACFTKLTDIVEAFMEKFEDELLPPDLPSYLKEIPTLDDMIAEELANADLPDEDYVGEEEPNFKSYIIAEFLREYREEYQEKYGNKADEILNEEALKEFEYEVRSQCSSKRKALKEEREAALINHKKEVQKNLFNRFRRLHIDHPQFPNKYRALFIQTRDEHCANYRTQDLSSSENLTRELEILYGYQKHLIFQMTNPKETMKHMSLAHQILKTLVAHNAVNSNQEVVDITPQNTKALADTQNVLNEQLNEIAQQLEQLNGTLTD